MTKDPITRRAVLRGDTAMVDLHLAAVEHRLAATERSLVHALLCHEAGCLKCRFLWRDLQRRVADL